MRATPASGAQLLGDVGARRQRVARRRREHDDAQAFVPREIVQSRVDRVEQGAVERVALQRTVEPQHLDAVRESLA